MASRATSETSRFPTANSSQDRARVRTSLRTLLSALLVAAPDAGPATAAEDAQEYQSFFESAPVGQLVVDGSRRIRRANPAAERLFLLPAGGLRGRPFSELIAKGSQALVDQAFASVGAGTGPRFLVDGRRADGSMFEAEVAILRLRSTSGEIYGVVVRDPHDLPTAAGRAPGGAQEATPYTLAELLMANRVRDLV